MKQFAIILLLFTLYSCGNDQKATVAPKSQTPVRTARVTEESNVIRIAGTVQSEDSAIIASKFAGFIQRVPAKSGMLIKQGELLIAMDDRNLSAQSGRLTAMRSEASQAFKEAKDHLDAAKAQKELAEVTFSRIKRLHEKNSASLQELDEAKARYESAQAELSAIETKVFQADAKIEQLKSDGEEISANLSYVRIAAPFDGVVTSVEVDEGDFVNPGQPLVRVEHPKNYQILFAVEQELLPLLKEATTLDVEIEDTRMKATVVEIGPSLHHATRTFPIKANLSANIPLRSGISGVVILPSKSKKSLWIPKTFLIRKSGLETVFVKRGDDWQRALVRSGKTKNDSIEILSGLNRGDEIGLFEE